MNSDYKLRPALCLDLDGTVRRTKSGNAFIQSLDDIELMPGIEKIIWKYREHGYLILGISNQGGVAHGFKSVSEIMEEVDATVGLFKVNMFDMVKCCYHDEKGTTEPYNHRSLLRKPNIGMLALMETTAWQNGIIIDWNNSLFVGDRPEDEQCAKNAEIPFQHIDDFLNSPHTFTVK
jgi:D-glycero-D-manno-heptose 1,7-bisphosphate phosphatase